MESINNKTGKIFTGKFAETAVKIGIATPVNEEGEASASEEGEVKKVQPKGKARPAHRGKRTKK